MAKITMVLLRIVALCKIQKQVCNFVGQIIFSPLLKVFNFSDSELVFQHAGPRHLCIMILQGLVYGPRPTSTQLNMKLMPCCKFPGKLTMELHDELASNNRFVAQIILNLLLKVFNLFWISFPSCTVTGLRHLVDSNSSSCCQLISVQLRPAIALTQWELKGALSWWLKRLL